jgi:integrase
MYTETIPTSGIGEPVKIVRDPKSHRVVKVYKTIMGFCARHSYSKPRWQKFSTDLESITYQARQELNRLRNVDVNKNEVSKQDLADLEFIKQIAKGYDLKLLAREWDDFKKRFSVKEISIDEAVELYLETYKENQKKAYFQSSSVYVKKLARYASGKMLLDVANVDFIEEYGRTLRGKKKGPQGGLIKCEPSGSQKKQNRFHLKRFFDYMQIKGYLPETLKDPTRLLDVKRTETSVYFISPKAGNDFVLNTPIELIPYVVLGKFIGVRPEEGIYEQVPQSKEDLNNGLLWEDFKFRERRIILRQKVTKLPKDRVVVMDDLVFDILSIFDGMSGPVHPLDPQKTLKKTLSAKAGWEWVRNGIRHSCATMRIQRGDDRVRILSEMQTSDDMLRNHYDESAKASPGDYLKWFGLHVPAHHKWESIKRDRGFIPDWHHKITPEFIDLFNRHMRQIAAKYPLSDLA